MTLRPGSRSNLLEPALRKRKGDIVNAATPIPGRRGVFRAVSVRCQTDRVTHDIVTKAKWFRLQGRRPGGVLRSRCRSCVKARGQHFSRDQRWRRRNFPASPGRFGYRCPWPCCRQARSRAQDPEYRWLPDTLRAPTDREVLPHARHEHFFRTRTKPRFCRPPGSWNFDRQMLLHSSVPFFIASRHRSGRQTSSAIGSCPSAGPTLDRFHVFKYLSSKSMNMANCLLMYGTMR